MPNIMSPVKEIDDIVFLRWDKVVGSKPVRLTVVRVGNTLVARTSKGRFVTDSLRNFAYTVAAIARTKTTIEGLVKLGVISQAQMNHHVKMAKLAEARDQLKHDRQGLARLEAKYGKQLRALRGKVK